MSTEAERRPMVRVAPLIPLALAVAAGVVADRFDVAWSTTAWASLALLACAVAVIGVVRRRGEVAQVVRCSWPWGHWEEVGTISNGRIWRPTTWREAWMRRLGPHGSGVSSAKCSASAPATSGAKPDRLGRCST